MSEDKVALTKGKSQSSKLSLAKISLDEAGKPIQEQLKDILVENAVRVIDLFREWDEDGDGTVSKKEFRKAMPMLGLEVPKHEIDALFDSWDPDGSGEITLKELSGVLKATPAKE